MTMLDMIRIVIVAAVCIVAVQTAPKSKKSSEPYYDQKQTGSYNVRLKLKGVQLITMFDDVGNFGDYDYNYDYADLTMKPVLPMFTVPPNLSSSTQKPQVTTPKLNPPINETTSSTSTPNVTKVESLHPNNETIVVIKPVVLNGNITSIKNITMTLNDTSLNDTDNAITVNSNTTQITSSSADVNNTTNDGPNQNVIVIPEHFSLLSSLMGFDKFAHQPGNNNQQVEGHQPRRCASGFKRDKRGRCRRLRRRNNIPNYQVYNPSKRDKNWW